MYCSATTTTTDTIIIASVSTVATTTTITAAGAIDTGTTANDITTFASTYCYRCHYYFKL